VNVSNTRDLLGLSYAGFVSSDLSSATGGVSGGGDDGEDGLTIDQMQFNNKIKSLEKLKVMDVIVLTIDVYSLHGYIYYIIFFFFFEMQGMKEVALVSLLKPTFIDETLLTTPINCWTKGYIYYIYVYICITLFITSL
jgi:hypothetical protein